MDEIGADIADEGVAICDGSGTDVDAAGAGEVATGAAVAFDETGDEATGAPASADDAPWFFGGRAEDGSGGAVGGGVDERAGGREERVGWEGGAVVGDPDEVAAVAADEAVAPLVEGETELGGAAFGSEVEERGVEGEVGAVEGDGRFVRMVRAMDRAAVAGCGAVDPAVGGVDG